MPEAATSCWRPNMNAKLSAVLPACVAVLVSACGSSPQSLILGKWEAASAKVGGADAGPEVGNALNAVKMTAEFNRDGTARITMLGQTLQGTYKLNGENELEGHYSSGERTARQSDERLWLSH